MGNAALGYDSTLPVTFEEVASRTAAVARATEDALVVADMPFLSFGVDEAESVRNAGRLLKEADADAVKIESGPHTVEMTRRMTDIGIPVMAHLGLTPQHVNRLGGYTRQGNRSGRRRGDHRPRRRARRGRRVRARVGARPREPRGRAVTEALEIPTIGIGAGSDCDGQVLVINDVVGLGGVVATLCPAVRRRARRDARRRRGVQGGGGDGRRVPGRGTLARRGGPRRPVLIGILVEIHSFETTGAAQTLGRGRVPDRSGQYGHGDDRCRVNLARW